MGQGIPLSDALLESDQLSWCSFSLNKGALSGEYKCVQIMLNPVNEEFDQDSIAHVIEPDW